FAKNGGCLPVPEAIKLLATDSTVDQTTLPNLQKNLRAHMSQLRALFRDIIQDALSGIDSKELDPFPSRRAGNDLTKSFYQAEIKVGYAIMNDKGEPCFKGSEELSREERADQPTRHQWR